MKENLQVKNHRQRMRKSARAVKPVEVLTYNRVDRDEDDVVVPDDDNDDDEEDYFEQRQQKKQPRKKQQQGLKGKPAVVESNKDTKVVGNDTLFGEVRNTKMLSTTVDKWIESYQIDRITATVELINFVLMAAGATKEWIPPDVDLDALEPEELDELLSDMVQDLIESGTKLYPLVKTEKVGGRGGGSGGSGGVTFRERYVMFWDLLCDQLQNSEEEFVASRENVNMLRCHLQSQLSIQSLIYH